MVTVGKIDPRIDSNLDSSLGSNSNLDSKNSPALVLVKDIKKSCSNCLN
jgi:hypothetical protein